MASAVDSLIAPMVSAIKPARRPQTGRAPGKPLPDQALASIPTEAIVSEQDAAPWLPVRYARPLWPAARTVAQPGADEPARTLALGAFLSIHEEAEIDGALWYRTGGGDWIGAAAVALLQPSNLRGVELAAQGAPFTPLSDVRSGVITADGLNIRSGPGAQHPVASQAVAHTRVSIFEQAEVDGATWYRIGSGLWVHGDWVSVAHPIAALEGLNLATPPQPELPVGWVVADVLNVRAAPGTAPENTVVDRLPHNQAVSILEAYAVDGEPWHRVGPERWIAGRPAAIGVDERWVAVDLSQQTLVAYHGDRPVYAALVATGLPSTPTVQGVFRPWWRVPACRMTGGAPNSGSYYYLEDVT